MATDPALDPATLLAAAEAACRAGLRAGLPELDARDVAQEAVMRALTTARAPAGVPFAAWVYGIARNLGRDHRKAAQRRELLVPGPERAADDDLATVLSVRRAIDELPDALRDIVTLHELEEHSLRETAAALCIPFDTAKDRLRRAREQLRVRLADPDAAYEHERHQARRRAAAHGAAIVGALWLVLADRGIAAAAVVAPLVTSAVRTWLVATAAAALVASGFAVGRFTHATAAPTAESIARAQLEAPTPVELAAAAPAAPDVPPPVIRAAVASPAAPPPRAARARAPAARAAIEAPAPPASPGASDELLLVERARAGIARGLYDDALVTLMSHARQFPDGVLAEERDVLVIEAYTRAGHADLAARSVARYRLAYPDGALRARVAELTGSR